MPRDAVSRTAHVGTVGKNGLKSFECTVLASCAPESLHQIRNFSTRETNLVYILKISYPFLFWKMMIKLFKVGFWIEESLDQFHFLKNFIIYSIKYLIQLGYFYAIVNQLCFFLFQLLFLRFKFDFFFLFLWVVW